MKFGLFRILFLRKGLRMYGISLGKNALFSSFISIFWCVFGIR